MNVLLFFLVAHPWWQKLGWDFGYDWSPYQSNTTEHELSCIKKKQDGRAATFDMIGCLYERFFLHLF